MLSDSFSPRSGKRGSPRGDKGRRGGGGRGGGGGGRYREKESRDNGLTHSSDNIWKKKE